MDIDIPEPSEIRQLIAIKRAEIAELKELLRLAELRRTRRLAGLAAKGVAE
jgi:hypothetical protein